MVSAKFRIEQDVDFGLLQTAFTQASYSLIVDSEDSSDLRMSVDSYKRIISVQNVLQELPVDLNLFPERISYLTAQHLKQFGSVEEYEQIIEQMIEISSEHKEPLSMILSLISEVLDGV